MVLEPRNRQEDWYKEMIDAIGEGGGVLVVTDTAGTLDKTWQEIHDAMLVGCVVIDDGTNSFSVIGAIIDIKSGEYNVSTCGLSGTSLRVYTTDSASGYPYS